MDKRFRGFLSAESKFDDVTDVMHQISSGLLTEGGLTSYDADPITGRYRP